MSSWRNAILCLSQVLVNGLQIVKKFNFICISFAFVLHISCSRFPSFRAPLWLAAGTSLLEAPLPSPRAGTCSGSMVICTSLSCLVPISCCTSTFQSPVLCMVSAGFHEAMLGSKNPFSTLFYSLIGNLQIKLAKDR